MIEKSKALCDLTLTIVSCTQPSRNRLIGSLPTMTPAASKGKKKSNTYSTADGALYFFSLANKDKERKHLDL